MQIILIQSETRVSRSERSDNVYGQIQSLPLSLSSSVVQQRDFVTERIRRTNCPWIGLDNYVGYGHKDNAAAVLLLIREALYFLNFSSVTQYAFSLKDIDSLQQCIIRNILGFFCAGSTALLLRMLLHFMIFVG